MRTIKFLALSLFIALVLNACKSKDSPEAVAEKFMNHLRAHEYAKAKEYGTEATKQMVQMVETLEQLGGENAGVDEEKPAKIKITSCEIDGDTAVCKFDEDGEPSDINLVKVDGKWLVDMKKESPFGDMDFGDETEWEFEEGEEEVIEDIEQ